MRSSVLFCLVPVALWAEASPSPANVTISDAATANMTCFGGVCAPTAAEAALNVQALEAMLASGNATVTTTGAGVQAKDIRVNAKLSWSAATTLALDAYHSIEVNRRVTVSGRGSVSLIFSNAAGGYRGEFACNDNGRIAFSSFSSALTINGTQYMLINSIVSLASAIAANPSGAFAFATNYDAKKDGTYTSSPIATTFSGSFNGLGNTISNLSINDPTQNDYVGLFAQTGTGSALANVRLVSENVQGGLDSSVGGLVGSAGGTIANSFTSGMVSDSGTSYIGGLIGTSGNVTRSGSSAVVSGGANGSAGGLIGEAGGTISDSWATGNVSGGSNGSYGYSVGGLVGDLFEADIKHSWASGQASATGSGSAGGGLVGEIEGSFASVERSHASGAVTCQGSCGGLVGTMPASDGPIKISQSYATGNVTATSSAYAAAGGLLGDSSECDGCEVVNSYASGTVSGGLAGGLVGYNGIAVPYHSISGSYAAGAVNSTNLAGGLIGSDDESPYGLLKHTYWDTTTSGVTDSGQGAGYPASDPGIKGLSDKKLKSGLPRGFDPKIWNENPNINNGLPYLINNLPPK